MTSLDYVAELISRDHGLAVVTTLRPAGSIAASVVNVGVLPHAVTGEPRAGWKWAAVEGHADLVGPFDSFDGFAPDQLAGLLRDIYTAAGGKHDDWAAYDAAVAAERRTAVLIRPRRVNSNPS